MIIISQLLLRARYNEMSASRAAAKELKLKKKIYEHGDKARRLLAWRRTKTN